MQPANIAAKQFMTSTFLSEVKSLLGCTQLLGFNECHSVRPHVSVQVSLRLKRLPTHFTFCVELPVTVLVNNIHVVFSLTLIITLDLSLESAQALRLPQSMNDEEMSCQ